MSRELHTVSTFADLVDSVHLAHDRVDDATGTLAVRGILLRVANTNNGIIFVYPDRLRSDLGWVRVDSTGVLVDYSWRDN